MACPVTQLGGTSPVKLGKPSLKVSQLAAAKARA